LIGGSKVKIPTVRILLLVALAAAYSGISGCKSSGTGNGSSGESPAPVAEIRVKAIPVRLDDWNNTVPISGTLHTLSSVDVKTEVGGRLIGVHAFEGDLVHKGSLLAEIDDANYQLAYQQTNAALKVAQAGLERAKVSAAYAKTEKERADNLLRTGGITQKDHRAAIAGMQELR
jgi:membrane fusion protein (multidrug efflux system)